MLPFPTDADGVQVKQSTATTARTAPRTSITIKMSWGRTRSSCARSYLRAARTSSRQRRSSVRPRWPGSRRARRPSTPCLPLSWFETGKEGRREGGKEGRREGGKEGRREGRRMYGRLRNQNVYNFQVRTVTNWMNDSYHMRVPCGPT